MQRYNMFTQVHKGLRALLFETAIELQHADFWNVDDCDCLIQNIQELISLFEKHADSEDRFVFPTVQKYEPSVTDLFEQEHVKDHLLGEQLELALANYLNAAIITEKAAAGQQIRDAFGRFLVFNLEHMAKEEEILNPILWRYYNDKELHAVTLQIISNIPPDYMARYSKWMMRGLNNAEITGWLKEVEKGAPAPVFQSLFGLAEQQLPNNRFRQVLEGLTEGAMLA